MYHFPSTWRRLIAHIIDSFYIKILQAPVWIKISMDYINHDELRVHWSDLTYLLLVGFSYDILSLYFFSATLGKWQLSLKVISREKKGESDSVRLDQAFLRALVARLSFFFGWSIFALAFLKINRTHLADWIADTQVVGFKERSRPRVRWILALGFAFLTLGESLKAAARTLQSVQWHDPYVYYDSEVLEKFLNDLEYRMDYQQEDQD